MIQGCGRADMCHPIATQHLSRDECLYLVTRSLDPTGRGKARWAIRWKPALNAFAITLDSPITRPTGNQCQGRIQR
jgi:hypothetical protein